MLAARSPVLGCTPLSQRRAAGSLNPARPSLNNRRLPPARVASLEPPISAPQKGGQQQQQQEQKEEGPVDLSARPPFSLRDIKEAIPGNCWNKDTFKSFSYLALDVGVVAALAITFHSVSPWFAWPLYWFMQGTMFWALFVVGHDCGHQSFSNSKVLNNFVGNIVHSTILVPYHGWRISHRNHHANHGHVENDESWHPVRKSLYDEMDPMARIGRLTLPWSMLAYPFYLWKRSPGKEGSHYDPNCDLFQTKTEKEQCMASNYFLLAWLGVLGACTIKLGIPAMLNLYVMPYWFFVMWLDVVTYLHHHGSSDANEKLPWYRGEEWNFLRGGLTTLDRDYGIFSGIQHSIGIHLVHHLFPQIPHYNLQNATDSVKPVLGPYYREPEKSPGWFPTHLFKPLIRSFDNDHYVEDTGGVVYYKRDPSLPTLSKALGREPDVQPEGQDRQ